jgi:hypothetical protein
MFRLARCASYVRSTVEHLSDGVYLAVDLRVVDTTSGEGAFARTIG